MPNTRVLWASARARDVWEPRIQAVSAAWARVEIASVVAGLRRAALVFGEPKTYGMPYREVAPNRFAVGGYDEADALAAAYAAGDDEAIGSLLGFPTCCREFFLRHRVPGDVDTTWAMAGADEVTGPPEANILGRWLGVRMVPHLPCSFACEATVASARRLRALWPARELQWAFDMLSWPTEWSAVHGVAEVKMPVLKFVTPTTVVEPRRVQYLGDRYPDEGARGLVFPYRRRMDIVDESLWRDNGFMTPSAQVAAHAMVFGAMPPHVRTVVDLGCGNGRLLRKLVAEGRAETIVGVEADAAKAARASALGVDVFAGTIQDFVAHDGRAFDVALVSERRFEEMSFDVAARFDRWAMEHVRALLVYSYDAPMFAGLREVARGAVH